MKINSLCVGDAMIAKSSCDKLVYCGNEKISDGGIITVSAFCGNNDGDIYLNDISEDDVLEDACDYIITAGAKAIVRTCYDLNETGRIEAKYKLSPIMLLHKLGVLEFCTIAGGVCLDNDDLDLMAQDGVSLIVTPSASAGYGHGFAPVCAAIKRGIKVGIGTYDGKYNKSHDLSYEAEFLRLIANAEMRRENALSEFDLRNILEFK